MIRIALSVVTHVTIWNALTVLIDVLIPIVLSATMYVTIRNVPCVVNVIKNFYIVCRVSSFRVFTPCCFHQPMKDSRAFKQTPK